MRAVKDLDHRLVEYISNIQYADDTTRVAD